MKLISAKQMQLTDLIYILYPLLIFIQNKMMLFYPYFITNSFFFTFYLFSGLLFGGSVQIFSNILYYCKTNSRTNSKLISLKSGKLFVLMPGRFKFNHKCLSFTIIIGLAASFAVTLYSRFFIAKHLNDPTHTCDMFYNLFCLVFFIIFSKLILHIDLFIHHFISSGFIVLGIIGVYYHTVAFDQLFDIFFYDLLFTIIYALPYVYSKYAMINKFMEPLSLAFYTGLVGIIMLLCVYLICQYCNLDYTYTEDILSIGNSFIEIYSQWDNIIMLFAMIVLQSVIILGTFSLIYNENPVIQQIAFHSTGVFEVIYSWIVAFNIKAFLITLFGVGFFVFGLLSYIEVIVIHCCEIDQYSKMEIIKRSEIELNELIKDYDVLEFGVMENDEIR